MIILMAKLPYIMVFMVDCAGPEAAASEAVAESTLTCRGMSFVIRVLGLIASPDCASMKNSVIKKVILRDSACYKLMSNILTYS